MEDTEIPRFLRSTKNTNGRVSEAHASKSMYFAICPKEGETREFQIVSTDTKRGVSVFRCTICGFRTNEADPTDSPAQAENNKKE